MVGLDEDRHDELVLVVDDDAAGRRLLAKILDRNGYPCITAGNIAEARQRMEEEKFALILTDMDMPRMGGIELVQQLILWSPLSAAVTALAGVVLLVVMRPLVEPSTA